MPCKRPKFTFGRLRLRKYVRENHCSAIVQIAPCRVNGACRLLATVGGSGVDNTQCTVYNEDHHNNMDLAMNFHNRPTQSTPGGVLRAVTWVRAPPKQEHERDDLLLAIGGDDCIITIISVTHKRVMHQLVGHNGPVLALEGHPVLQGVLASMGEDHKVHLWLVPSHNAEGVGGAPRRLATLLLSGRTHAMTFLHDGRLLTAHSAGEGLLRLWQLPEFEGLACAAPSAEAPADEEADDDSDSDWSGSSDGEASAGGPPSGRAGLKHGRSANRPTGSRRLRWSVAEEQALRDGIAKFGLGKWRAIQKDPNFGPILTIRSNGDLKDKWRNLCKEEAKVAKVAQIGDQRKAADKAASAAASAGADGNAYVAAAPTSDGEASAGEGAQEAGDGYDEHGLDAEGLSKYERERLARIAANHARMEAMLGHSLRAAEVAAAASKPKARARPRKRAKRSEGEEPAQLLRRSARRCAQALPPRDARELTLETLRAAEQGAALEIYWPEDATWYDATLTVARPETNEWDIRYPEDGVEETLRLSDPELPPVRPRGCAAAVSNPAQGDALLPEELTMAEHSRAVCAAADARGAQVASMTTIGSHSVATMRANGQLEVWTLPADGMDRGAIRISGTRVPGYNTEERFVACKIGASECGSFVAVGNGVGDTYVYAVDVPGMPKQVGHAPANKRARSPVVAATITGRGTRVLSASGKGFIWRYEPDPGETKKNTSGAWAGQL